MGYYAPCPELDACNRLIRDYFETKQYDKCFQGHLPLAEKGYPLAECQIGYFYFEGLGVEKDPERAFFWTRRAAEHGDRDAQYNLACFLEAGVGCSVDREKARSWLQKAAEQGQALAIEKCNDIETEG